MKIRFGLIGAGRMGATFAYYLAYSIEEAELFAVADAVEPIAREVANRFGARKFYGDYRALLDQEAVDAVVIASPTNTHPEIIKAVAKSGKHIFCEKPLALTLEECDEAIEAARKAGVKLQIGFMRRYDSGYLSAKEHILNGAIGQPVMFKSIGRDPRRTSLKFAQRSNSGGLIMDMAIHDFDLARWIMESEVERVHSEGGCLVFPELKGVGDIDNAVVNIKFENGSVGNVDVSRNAVYGYDIRTEILGSEGGLMIGKMQNTPLLIMRREGISHDAVPYFMERFPEAYSNEIRDFVNCILEDREPRVTGDDGRMATAIGIAATKSLDEERPVKLSEILSKISNPQGENR